MKTSFSLLEVAKILRLSLDDVRFLVRRKYIDGYRYRGWPQLGIEPRVTRSAIAEFMLFAGIPIPPLNKIGADL